MYAGAFFQESPRIFRIPRSVASAEKEQHEEGNDLAGVALSAALRQKQDQTEDEHLLVPDAVRKEGVRLRFRLLATFARLTHSTFAASAVILGR